MLVMNVDTVMSSVDDSDEQRGRRDARGRREERHTLQHCNI